MAGQQTSPEGDQNGSLHISVVTGSLEVIVNYEPTTSNKEKTRNGNDTFFLVSLFKESLPLLLLQQESNEKVA